MTRNGSDRARFGPFEVDLHTHELWKFGTRLKLVGQPFEILSVLLSKPGELVTREEIRTRLWPADTFVDFNHGLNAAVNKLREALSDSAEAPRYVETLPRRGYRFIATVEWVAANPALAARANLNPPTSIREDFPLLPQPREADEDRHDDNEDKEGSASGRWPQFVIGSGVLVAMLLMGTFLLKTVSGYSARFVNRSSPQRIRPLNSVGIEPAFSPDGNSVAFVRDGGKPGEAGVFVMPVGSDHPTQLTHNDRDCCPVWSPDGRSIAFSRFANKEISIYLVSADGGAEQKRAAEKAPNPTSAAFTVSAAGFTERKLNTSGVVSQHGEIEWAPDGKSIVFSGASGLYLLSLDNSSLHRLTEPPAMAEDWGPTFSPDGEKLLFVRNHQVGLPDEIWYTSATGGSATRILSEPGRIVSAPQWSYDGRAVIYSSNRNGHPALWRASIDTPDSAVQMKEAGSPAWDPAVSRRGYRMAYERIIRSLSIWQLDLSSARHEPPSVLVASTSDTDQGPGPQFSPDSKKLAYMSDRSGTMEIWVSNRDGSNPFQLTAVGVAGTPRWSPDSQSIVFDTNSPNGPEILSINLRGGAPLVLTQDKYENQVPSWSHDGKWIYFASDRTGAREVWKIPASGGEQVQLTHHGGHAALESLDGKVVYYAKTFLPEPEIWQIPLRRRARDAPSASASRNVGELAGDRGRNSFCGPVARAPGGFEFL